MKKPIRAICPTCQQEVKDDWRVISLTTTLVDALWKARNWCKDNKTLTFRMGDIRSQLDHVQYSTFNNLRYFGFFLVENDEYLIDMERVDLFYAGKLAMPLKAYKHGITKQIQLDAPGSIHEVPHIADFIDRDGRYQAEYVIVRV